MPMIKDREYRIMPMPLTADAVMNEQKRIDSTHYVEGYATTFDKPYILFEQDGIEYFECIAHDALEGADMSDVIMQYNHEGKVFARTSNHTLGLIADRYGLLVYADLSKSAAARELHGEIKAELITQMSWAFTVASEEYDRKTHTRTITKIKKVYDVSAVSCPANPDTEISARSFCNGVIAKARRETLVRQLRILEIIKKTED